MPVTVTVDPNFIYAMLKEYNDAVYNKNIGGTTLSNAYLAVLYYNSEVKRLSLSSRVYTTTGGALIDYYGTDSSSSVYTTDGVAYRFQRTIDTTTYTYELFRVSFPSATKGSSDALTLSISAELKVG